MAIVSIRVARSQLSGLIELAARGEDVIILRRGKPIARLTRVVEVPSKIRFGLLKGKARVPRDFDAPLPDEVLAAFEGR